MSKPKNNVNDLLAAIKRQTTVPSTAKVPDGIAPAKRDTPQQMTKKKAKSRIGKPVQFWMHEEDRKLVRELSAWLAGQGVRPTDSMVIRAVLRLAKTGEGFLEAYWEAAKLDGRIKRN